MKKLLLLIVAVLFISCHNEVEQYEFPRGVCLEKCVDEIIDNTTDADHYNQDLPLKAYETCNRMYPDDGTIACIETRGGWDSYSKVFRYKEAPNVPVDTRKR